MSNQIIESAIKEARLGKEINFQKAEDLLLDYLTTHPKDTEAWLLVTRIECGKSVEDADKIEFYAQKILNYDSGNPYALLFLVYAEYYLRGCPDDNLIHKLDKAKSEDPDILSMIELAKAYYWKHRDSMQYEEALKRSIEFCSQYVTNYYMLGEFYMDQGKILEGQKLMKMGLSNIKEEVIPENLDEPYDPTSITHFLAEFFSGIRTNFVVHKILLEKINE